MEDILSWVGLALVIIGWAIQLNAVRTVNNKNRISREFIFVQSIGVLVLAYTSFVNNAPVLGALNFVSAITALAILINLDPQQ